MHRVAPLILVACAAVSMPVWAADTTAPGVPKFHRVNERIYRGAQPDGEGWDSLAKLGVKTVIDLRPPNQISRVLGLLAPPASPVFMHCRRGADRTGTVIACYRITHDGWNNRR